MLVLVLMDLREGTVLPDFLLINGGGFEIGARGDAFWAVICAEAGRRTRTDRAGWPDEVDGGCILVEAGRVIIERAKLRSCCDISEVRDEVQVGLYHCKHTHLTQSHPNVLCFGES